MWEVFIRRGGRVARGGRSGPTPVCIHGIFKRERAGSSPRLRSSEGDGARKSRGLHLFSPPCSGQRRDDLCGAGAAATRRGRILAFSSAPSRVARVAECAIARFVLFLSFLSEPFQHRREDSDASFSDDVQLPAASFPFFFSVLCRTFPREAG